LVLACAVGPVAETQITLGALQYALKPLPSWSMSRALLPAETTTVVPLVCA
jgi:hypothetical protein